MAAPLKDRNDDQPKLLLPADVGASVSGQVNSTGACVGAFVEPGDKVGALVGGGLGNGVIVGPVVGKPLGASVVGAIVGATVGLDVVYREHSVVVASRQSGVNESNCWTFSKTAAKSHNDPLVLVLA